MTLREAIMYAIEAYGGALLASAADLVDYGKDCYDDVNGYRVVQTGGDIVTNSPDDARREIDRLLDTYLVGGHHEIPDEDVPRYDRAMADVT